ncbi:TIGR03084 family metal-binding protein [Erythrobacter sp. Alg231-14]|uniref:TIGR03084 family metal-binding protein n=1 Tax=Erythrobacter sp. Alg231-14 TaxID=1922225 RepID=UPI000D55170B
MQQAEDFRSICDQLNDLLADLDDKDFARTTGFKGWSIDEILRHLHVWNRAALTSLQDPDGFGDFMKSVAASRGLNFRIFESEQTGDLSGRALLAAWREFYPELADAFRAVDPKQRVAWAGPSMSARSSITARLMETWSHAQAIYDELGADRSDSDAIANIVVLGLNTYGWTFINRSEEVPQPVPQLVMTMPSGVVRTFGEGSGDGAAGSERIEGSATEFCQVVTQCRNIGDTALTVTGPNATRWMDVAQCFAGPPQDPPPPGARAKNSA